MITDNCEGCYTHITNGNLTCRYVVNDGTCPCSICIIKVMCHDGCKDFDDYVDMIRATEEEYDRTH